MCSDDLQSMQLVLMLHKPPVVVDTEVIAGSRNIPSISENGPKFCEEFSTETRTAGQVSLCVHCAQHCCQNNCNLEYVHWIVTSRRAEIH